MTRKGPAHPERSFGVSVGTVLLAVAAYSIWRDRFAPGTAIGVIGGLLLIIGLVRPRFLRYPSAVWWRFSRALGHVNARVLLTVIFVLVFTPIGIVWRITGHDPLRRQRATFPGWLPHPSRYRDPRHYVRMF